MERSPSHDRIRHLRLEFEGHECEDFRIIWELRDKIPISEDREKSCKSGHSSADIVLTKRVAIRNPRQLVKRGNMPVPAR